MVGRYFRGLKNGPSPRWLQDRLTAIGLRPISALVDITNYVTFDLGRPLHVFDADKLAGDLTMRLAREGERSWPSTAGPIALDPSMTVIADGQDLHGIGGVMGGEHSGCSETTTEMFLEVALFDPIRTAETGRKLGIESDARYRFERGLDPDVGRNGGPRSPHAWCWSSAAARRAMWSRRARCPSWRREPVACGPSASRAWAASMCRRPRPCASSRPWASRSSAAPIS